jgi:hypothetical protein
MSRSCYKPLELYFQVTERIDSAKLLFRAHVAMLRTDSLNSSFFWVFGGVNLADLLQS